jgi:hypothetical protein
MRIATAMIPAVIIDQYNVLPLIHYNQVFVEIRRGM